MYGMNKNLKPRKKRRVEVLGVLLRMSKKDIARLDSLCRAVEEHTGTYLSRSQAIRMAVKKFIPEMEAKIVKASNGKYHAKSRG